ncbi:P-loop containing nucleoside triphosphate hydrolase protein [Limtongia smithiae]|uniref:P-loop containing nucleoside triphosphate hydrolase protein n=1 Tax=Limtongia smithiae TaxID=1125753 RepID=UPI0034CD6210
MSPAPSSFSPRARTTSNVSDASQQSTASRVSSLDQENVYDYLAKIILVGPSSCGKSSILHRFVEGHWKVLASPTIGVEFSSKIIKVGTGARRKRIKLQLWDTAGQERFRAVTRSYYRGTAGALLVYDATNPVTFQMLPHFLSDLRNLASPTVSLLLVANKSDKIPSANAADIVRDSDVVDFASQNGSIPILHTSALSGQNIDEAFTRLANMILTKIELGELDPDDVGAGVQYGDPSWGDGSVRRPGAQGSGGMLNGIAGRGRGVVSLIGGKGTNAVGMRRGGACC